MRSLQAAIGAALLFVAAVGCAVPLDFGDPFPLQRPADADLPGRYLPTDETRAMVVKGGYSSRETSIELAPDGSFRVRDIPDWWRTDWGKPAGAFDTGQGKWRLVRDNSWWSLDLEFPNTKEFGGPVSEGSYLKGIYLMGQSPPYELMITVGDPDSGRWMRFKKVRP